MDVELEWILSLGSRTTIALSGLAIISGVVLIKLGRREEHRAVMASAAVLALIFVALYMLRSSLYPPAGYAGPNRGLYLWTLWSHTVLSVVNLPLAAYTIYQAVKGRFDRHRRVAPYTAAVWIYVAASGWTIFLFHG